MQYRLGCSACAAHRQSRKMRAVCTAKSGSKIVLWLDTAAGVSRQRKEQENIAKFMSEERFTTSVSTSALLSVLSRAYFEQCIRGCTRTIRMNMSSLCSGRILILLRRKAIPMHDVSVAMSQYKTS